VAAQGVVLVLGSVQAALPEKGDDPLGEVAEAIVGGDEDESVGSALFEGALDGVSDLRGGPAVATLGFARR
jgi:hypothetical protein